MSRVIWDALTALAAVVALGLSIYNTMQARREPERERLRDIREDLRRLYESFTHDTDKLMLNLNTGGDVGPADEGLKVTSSRIREHAERLAHPERLPALDAGIAINHVYHEWALTGSWERVGDTSSTNAVTDSRTNLRQSLEKARAAAKNGVEALNRYEQRGPRRGR